MFYDYWLQVRVTAYWLLVRVTAYWLVVTSYGLLFRVTVRVKVRVRVMFCG